VHLYPSKNLLFRQKLACLASVVLLPVGLEAAQTPQPTSYVVTTVAGNGTAGFDNGTGTNATFNVPDGVAVDGLGNIYVADGAFNEAIRKISATGVVTTYFSKGWFMPLGVALDGSGNIYMADFYPGGTIRMISATGVFSTLAGRESTWSGVGNSGFNNGIGTNATFSGPTAVAVDGSGNIYVADRDNHAIRKISAGNVVTTLAGNGTAGFDNGTGTNATFNVPVGVAVDGSGNIYVADAYNNAIRKISAGGVVTTLAGNGTPGFDNGTGTNATFFWPMGVTVDGSGNVYVGDTKNNAVRKISPGGVVTTLAGNGTAGFDNGTGTNATFNLPKGVALDGSGNIYVVDMDNNAIRKLSSSGLSSPTPTPKPSPKPVLVQWGSGPGTIPANALNSQIAAISCNAANQINSSVLTKLGKVIVWGGGACANVPTTAATGVSAISLGYDHMLALKNGAVIAWGNNGDGQATVPTEAKQGVVAISAGYLNSLALKSNGQVIGWGHGYSNFESNHHRPGDDLALINVNGKKVIGMASGGDFTAAGGSLGHTITGLVLFDDHTVQEFGDSFTDATIVGSRDVPAGLSGVNAIAIGARFALALKSDGTVVAWGDNSKGQLNVPSGLSGVIAISAGGFHALALRSDGTVVAWGDNTRQQSTVPPDLGVVKAVAAGRYHSMASLEGVGGSQTSGGGGSSSGVGRTPPATRVPPAPRVGVGSKSAAASGSKGSKSGAVSVISRSAPGPRAAPAPRK
jgi:hypothetical protein